MEAASGLRCRIAPVTTAAAQLADQRLQQGPVVSHAEVWRLERHLLSDAARLTLPAVHLQGAAW